MAADIAEDDARINIGILTKGKATLGMVLANLLLQEAVTVRIHVVDTSARPVITRDDVRFAMRLAGDRGIHCSYDFVGESDLAFSGGKSRLVRTLTGRHLCMMDDDVVMPSDALKRLFIAAEDLGTYGYISPLCKNSPILDGSPANQPEFAPGSLMYQDTLIHDILLEYYATTIDVLDQRKSEQKVWEKAFLTALFQELDRRCVRQDETVTYHLDYQEGPHWIEEERTVIARSRLTARSLVERRRNGQPAPVARLPRPAAPAPRRRTNSLARWARKALRI